MAQLAVEFDLSCHDIERLWRLIEDSQEDGDGQEDDREGEDDDQDGQDDETATLDQWGDGE
ncbi:hypothetical protein [Haloarcula onubensis]|uniref:Uncharacterized protein n=1 Tax=Haloarcula onubensis TaxID=2950539 RepID=A0ABU2FVH8_9EURY|nr:hypothetical protein [Halomicroarcula sp. S3CR25-11]MDS0284765.1 hypothetical protein [Halomicroarcula sp. S3CR25-11]